VSGQPGTVGAGALDPDPLERPVPAQAAQQLAVAGRGGRRLRVADLTPDPVEHRRMVGVAMGVDPGRDRSNHRPAAGQPRASHELVLRPERAGAAESLPDQSIWSFQAPCPCEAAYSTPPWGARVSPATSMFGIPGAARTQLVVPLGSRSTPKSLEA
jgi:hypothetical protein